MEEMRGIFYIVPLTLSAHYDARGYEDRYPLGSKAGNAP